MANPQSVRYLNEIRALNALFREGGMSRADLSRSLGLTRSSVGYIVQDLLSDGLARERKAVARPQGEARAGRPGIVVELDPHGATFLGAEIGVDRITVVAIDLAAREFLRRSVEYPTGARAPGAGLARTAALLNDAIASLKGGAERIKGVCIAIPALVRDGVVRNGLILGWRNVAVRRLLKQQLKLDVPVLVENDANAFAMGETYRGASARSDVVACLLIENGAGGGIVIGGQLLRGATGFAGELGQLPLGGKGFFAGRHKAGHLESYIGKDAVVARYRANGAPPRADLQHLLAGLRNSEPVALQTAGDWGERLAKGLVHIANTLAPGLIILGGSVAPIYPHVASKVQEAMRDEFLEGFPVPKIELSRLGAGGAAFGGACLLHQGMFSVDERLVHSQGEPLARRPAANSKRRWLPVRQLTAGRV